MTGADLKALKVMEEYAKETIIRVAGDVDKEIKILRFLATVLKCCLMPHECCADG